MISFSASSKFGHSGQYIARITGRHKQYTFEREFIGRKGGKRNEETTADVDDPGLYECCDVDKHGKESRYYLVLEAEGNLIKLRSDKEDAMTIGKAMEAGRSLQEIVVVGKNDDNTFYYEIVSAKEAEKRQTAQTLDTAIEQCWAILQPLPLKEAKKVLAALKIKLTPATTDPAPAAEQGVLTEPSAASEQGEPC